MATITFQIKLASSTIELPDVERLIGKEVMVTITEVPSDKTSKPRKWHYLGAVNLNGLPNDKNMRDLAYE